MATSGQGIWFSLGNKSVRDYKHAAQIFRTNDYARAPKYKFLFYVTFNLNPAASSDQFTDAPAPVGPNELSYLVKTIDMPRFQMEVQELNQYNKKVLVQRSIQYTPINIKFHDDNIGSLRNFWRSYYNYYYADGSYNDIDYIVDDKYDTRQKSRWGLDTGSTSPYLDSISIYCMNGSNAQKMTIHNPLITNFTHDTLDYADNTGTVEANMTVRYTGVTYDDNIDSVFGIEGFGQDAPETYDVTMSPLTSGVAGLQVNFSTGQLFNKSTANGVKSKKTYSNNPNRLSQTLDYNRNVSTASAIISNNQLAVALQNTYDLPNRSGYIFPTINTKRDVNVDYGAVNCIKPAVCLSDGDVILTPAQRQTLYPTSSWQNALLQKGYTPSQITAADYYIMSQGTGAFGAALPPDENGNSPPGPNYQEIAEQYLKNPNSMVVASDYGHPPPMPISSLTDANNNLTQAVYNGQNLEQSLSEKGYDKDSIRSVQQFISSIKLAPGTDINAVAEDYLANYSSINGN